MAPDVHGLLSGLGAARVRFVQRLLPIVSLGPRRCEYNHLPSMPPRHRLGLFGQLGVPGLPAWILRSRGRHQVVRALQPWQLLGVAASNCVHRMSCRHSGLWLGPQQPHGCVPLGVSGRQHGRAPAIRRRSDDELWISSDPDGALSGKQSGVPRNYGSVDTATHELRGRVRAAFPIQCLTVCVVCVLFACAQRCSLRAFSAPG